MSDHTANSTIRHGRLLLLILATGLFVFLWERNTPSPGSRAIPTVQRNPASRLVTEPNAQQLAARIVGDLSAAGQKDQDSPSGTLPEQPSNNTDAPAGPSDFTLDLFKIVPSLKEVYIPQIAVETLPEVVPTWTVRSAPIPLPAELAAGSYRVVSNQGALATLTIPASESSPTAVSGSVSQLVLQSMGDVQWFFIRLQELQSQPASPESLETTDLNEIPALPNDTFADRPTKGDVVSNGATEAPPGLETEPTAEKTEINREKPAELNQTTSQIPQPSSETPTSPSETAASPAVAETGTGAENPQDSQPSEEVSGNTESPEESEEETVDNSPPPKDVYFPDRPLPEVPLDLEIKSIQP